MIDHVVFWSAMLLGLLLIIILVLVFYFLIEGVFSVPWVKTPKSIARKMLDLVQLQPGDIVLDLGSGDGSIVFEAAKRGAIGIGLERLRPLVWYARFLSRMKGLSARTSFFVADIFTDPLPSAHILTSYLFSEVNARLEPRLCEVFPPGTRVVSRDFCFPNLRLIDQCTYRSSAIYVYEL